MKTRLRMLKENRRGGFTLVELIVVLVILAILASFLIPTLTGYIDKARDEQIILQTRQAVMAAQTLFDEAYGAGTTPRQQSDVLSVEIGEETIADQIYELAELDSAEATIPVVSTDATGRISTLTLELKSGNGDVKKCVYNVANEGDPYTVTDGS